MGNEKVDRAIAEIESIYFENECNASALSTCKHILYAIEIDRSIADELKNYSVAFLKNLYSSCDTLEKFSKNYVPFSTYDADWICIKKCEKNPTSLKLGEHELTPEFIIEYKNNEISQYIELGRKYDLYNAAVNVFNNIRPRLLINYILSAFIELKDLDAIHQVCTTKDQYKYMEEIKNKPSKLLQLILSKAKAISQQCKFNSVKNRNNFNPIIDDIVSRFKFGTQYAQALETLKLPQQNSDLHYFIRLAILASYSEANDLLNFLNCLRKINNAKLDFEKDQPRELLIHEILMIIRCIQNYFKKSIPYMRALNNTSSNICVIMTYLSDTIDAAIISAMNRINNPKYATFISTTISTKISIKNYIEINANLNIVIETFTQDYANLLGDITSFLQMLHELNLPKMATQSINPTQAYYDGLMQYNKTYANFHEEFYVKEIEELKKTNLIKDTSNNKKNNKNHNKFRISHKAKKALAYNFLFLCIAIASATLLLVYTKRETAFWNSLLAIAFLSIVMITFSITVIILAYFKEKRAIMIEINNYSKFDKNEADYLYGFVEIIEAQPVNYHTTSITNKTNNCDCITSNKYSQSHDFQY